MIRRIRTVLAHPEADTMLGQLEIEVEAAAYRWCSRLTNDKHRWGPARQDAVLGLSRQCRWCRTYEALPHTTIRTVGNTTWNVTTAPARKDGPNG